jgi:hypothetical protein
MLSAKKYSLFVIPSPLKHQRNISVFNGNTPICRGNMDCVKIHPFRAVLPFVFPIIAKFFVVGFKNQVPHLRKAQIIIHKSYSLKKNLSRVIYSLRVRKTLIFRIWISSSNDAANAGYDAKGCCLLMKLLTIH